MCIYDIIDELMNINDIKCKTSNQIFSETFHDNSMRFSAIPLFNYAQYYSIKSRPLSMTFKEIITVIAEYIHGVTTILTMCLGLVNHMQNREFCNGLYGVVQRFEKL